MLEGHAQCSGYILCLIRTFVLYFEATDTGLCLGDRDDKM